MHMCDEICNHLSFQLVWNLSEKKDSLLGESPEATGRAGMTCKNGVCFGF